MGPLITFLTMIIISITICIWRVLIENYEYTLDNKYQFAIAVNV
jgi:hypothetical protein